MLTAPLNSMRQLPTESESFRPSSPLKSKRKLTYQKNVSAEDSTLPPKWQNSNKTQQPSSIPNSALLRSSIASTNQQTHKQITTQPNPCRTSAESCCKALASLRLTIFRSSARSRQTTYLL